MSHQSIGKPSRRATGLVVALVVVGACGAASVASARGANAEPVASTAGTTEPVRTGRLFALRATAAIWGGIYTANTGEPVHIEISDAYPQDPALPQRWADYLASLIHGPELSTLTAFLAPFDEVQSICGEEALACYSAQAQTLVAPAEDPAEDVTTEAIVAHEYGHHVAANRQNSPWWAIDFGTKRWATYVNVCARATRGDLYPGAEDAVRYELNPGEGFAEAYRLLNQQRLGQPLLAWQIVSSTFVPDATALQLIEQDVRTPWTGPMSAQLAGSLAAGRTRTSTVATPLDGTARLTLRVSRGAVTAEVLAGAKRLARVGVSAGRGGSRSVTVCGQRSLRVRFTAAKRAARYTATFTRP